MKVLIVIISMFSVSQLYADALPAWRGIGNTAKFAAGAKAIEWTGKRPPEIWRVKVGLGYAAVIPDGDCCFTVGSDEGTPANDVVYCLEQKTGTELWRFTYPQGVVPKYNPGGPNAAPLVHENRVYVFGKEGTVHCLNRNDGSIVWRYQLNPETVRMPIFGYASTPVIVGERLFLNAGVGGWALDRNTGKELWHSLARDGGYGTVTPFYFHKTPCLALTSMQTIRIVEQATGKDRWQHTWKTKFGENNINPIVSEQILYYASWWGRGAIAFDLKTDPPTEIWHDENLQNHISGPVLHQGHLYGFDGPVHRTRVPSFFTCVDLKTGTEKWRQEGIIGSAFMVGKQMLVLTREGKLILVSPSTEAYIPQKEAQISGPKTWAPPVFRDGNLFFRTGDGHAVAVRLVPK